MDIFPDDILFFGPTAMQHDHFDYMTVLSYDPVTGITHFTNTFDHYHFGAYDTKLDYNNVDMRGEVAILTRNVVIEGTTDNDIGCQVVTTDVLERIGIFRRGQTNIQSVEITNCSQRDTDRAAVRFDGSGGRTSRVKDTAIHGGLGWGFNIYNSRNIEVEDVAVIGFK